MGTLKAKEVDFEETWLPVLGTVQSVMCMSQYGHTDNRTWQTRFSDIYDLCTASPDSHAERLYEKTKAFLEEHCRAICQDIADSEQNTLAIYVKYWSEYRIGAQHLNYLYRYLNSQVVKKGHTSEPGSQPLIDYYVDMTDQTFVEIGELALDCWTTIIIESLKDRFVNQLLEQIHLDRIGECSNQTTIKTAIMSFVDVYKHRKSQVLELYEKNFEAPFLQATGEYYREEGNQLLAKFDCIQYMKKILSLIESEEFRSRKFLNSTSYTKVHTECLQRLVCDHFDTLKAECQELIVREDLDALHNMYQLLKPTPIGINDMVERLQEHISNLGHEKIQSLKGENLPSIFVETLLDIHSKYLQIIRETFSNDSEFISALDKACAIIVNMKNGNRLAVKAPELLAQYCDSLLRKSTKTVSENDTEEKLMHAIIIFNYLDDKDYFQRFYQKMLARRLINQQSTSMDSEEFMVTKLKQICGYEFTGKLARMFQDIKVSSDLNLKFLEHLKSELSSNSIQHPTFTSLLGLDFNIFVLQANSWPVSQPTTNTFSIPPLLEKPLRMFETFYNRQYNGRKLCWMYHVSSADIRMSHLDRPYFITMGTYQMAILLLFNEHKELRLSEIEEATKLNPKELEKQIGTLIENKILLEKADEHLSVNFDFKSKRTKFKITNVAQRESHHDSESSQKAVDDDRKFYLQAIIVRVMKSRKTLKHNSLIEEVFTQLKQRFTPSVSLIKKCIEILIDKQYLQRKSADEYSYIA